MGMKNNGNPCLVCEKIVVCPLINLQNVCNLVVYIANNMDPGFIVFASMVKYSGVLLKICSRHYKHTTFSEQQYVGRISVVISILVCI